MHNDIPLARGLGSSAAATVGGDPRRQRARRRGAVDARAARSSPARSRAIPTTRRPPCSAGSSCRRATARRVEAIRFDSPRDLRAVLFIPELRLPTDEMRAALPAAVPLDGRGGQPRGGRGRGRRAGHRSLRPARPADRRPAPRAVPGRGLPAAAAHGRGGPDAGALGACLSGAGSTILAFADSMAGITRIEAAFFAAAADLDLAGRVAGRRAAQRGGAHRRPRLSGRSARPPTAGRLRGPRPDEREDLVPCRRACVGELGRLAVEEAVRRARVGDQPVVDAGRRRGRRRRRRSPRA